MRRAHGVRNAVADNSGAAEQKVAELSAIIHAVRDRVRARYPEPGNGANGEGGQQPPIQVALADLLPAVHARDAAQAKIAAIGSVNPRAGGPVNNLIQAVKRNIARALQWFVRDQVIFNREAVAAVEALIEALNEQNRALASLAGQTSERLHQQNREIEARTRELSQQIDVRAAELAQHFQPFLDALGPLREETRELRDIRRHWAEWRAEWERKVMLNEVQFLRAAADLQGAFQHRVTQVEGNFREIVKAQHSDYLGALERTTLDIQKKLWEDFQRVRGEYDRMIHSELRLIRMRAPAAVAAAAASAAPEATVAVQAAAPVANDFDYARFAERFRGDEEYVRKNIAFYRPFFEGRENVLDIGCGRGECLEMMRGMNVPARGIDLGEESVALCRQKGLAAEVADLFPYLDGLPEGEFDGMFSSQVVEHIDPARLGAMIRLCASRLRRGGVLAIETPNPECLAIFATHFYLDPTHTRPVPHPLLAFYMEEAGLGAIEVHKLSPAVETIPELAELPENLRNRLFGGLDYAIMGRRL